MKELVDGNTYNEVIFRLYIIKLIQIYDLLRFELRDTESMLEVFKTRDDYETAKKDNAAKLKTANGNF